MTEAIAKRKRETTEQALLVMFEKMLAEAGGGFVEREAEALRLANELVRRWLRVELERMATRYPDEIRVNGTRYRRHANGVRTYHTLCGPIDVRRDSYRQIGVHNGPTVVPLELEAGIIENATPALAFSVTQAFSERPLRHYEDEMRAAHRAVPSRSTLERVGKRTGERIKAALPTIEPIVRRAEALPREARSISVGVDRTTVPMAEASEQQTRARREPYVRRAPEPIVVAYRMAYIGTVAVNDAAGDTLVTKRFAATAEEGPEALMRQLAGEVKLLLEQRPRLPVAIVQDGAPELWNLTDAWLARDGITPAAKLIDRFHVDERLAEIAEAISVDDSTARWLYQQWRTQLERSDTAIDRICRRLNQLFDHQLMGATDGDPVPPYWRPLARRRLDGEAVEIAKRHVAYLDGHRRYLRYASPRKRGLPIGSGVTEGACKSVVTMRFKRSGQRWFEHGLSPCLHLRALHLNARLRPCFELIIAARSAALAAA